MIVLISPFVILLSCCLFLFFLYKRKWMISGLLLCVVAVLNVYTELFALGGFSKETKPDIKVMCFNVHLLDDTTRLRCLEIYGTIKQEDCDFVYLTEYYGTANDSLLDWLSKIYPYYDVSNRWGANVGDVFFSKWNIDSIALVIPKLSGGNVYRVQVSDKQDTLAIYCCHLYSNILGQSESLMGGIKKGYEERAQEADILYDALTHEKYPAIVMGDMNDISGSYTLRRIESAGLTDAWWKGGFGYGTTYHDHGLRLRLDHILYDEDRLQLTNVKVIDTDASDHNALSAGFKLKIFSV